MIEWPDSSKSISGLPWIERDNHSNHFLIGSGMFYLEVREILSLKIFIKSFHTVVI